MPTTPAIAFRCPGCAAVRFGSSLVADRFRCDCGIDTTVRNIDTIGGVDALARGAGELVAAAKIDLPSAHSVLLGLMRLDDVPVRTPAVPAADAASKPGPKIGASRTAPVSVTASPVSIESTERPRRSVQAFAALIGVAGIVIAIAFGVMRIAPATDRRVRIQGTSGATVRLDPQGQPIELRGADPASVLAEYCDWHRCIPDALAAPARLPPGTKLGLFRADPAGPRAAIEIRRLSAVEWGAGGGPGGIVVATDPRLPPGTAETPLR